MEHVPPRPPEPPVTPTVSGPIPARILRTAEIAHLAGDGARLHAALEALSRTLQRLTDAQMVTLLRLADRAGRPDIVADTVRQAFMRRVTSLPLALEILQLPLKAGDAELADAVHEILVSRMPPQIAIDYRIEAARVQIGPDAALELNRKVSGPRRTANDAASLGHLLIATGKYGLAIRYLRRCHLRWPSATKIRSVLMQAYLKSGYPDEAGAWLTSLVRQNGVRHTENLRLLFALATNQLTEAHTILTTQIAENRRKSGDMTLLRVLMSLERLEDAEDELNAIKSGLGQHSKIAGQFGISHTGAQLNEFRLYKRYHSRSENIPPTLSETTSHFFAAKEVLDAWRKAHPWKPGSVQRSSLPKRIFQYWNTEEIPPPVLDLMDSWSSVPGWDYTRLNRRTAITWLRQTFGNDHARAFKLANHVAEEADFLRLCLLFSEGGIYADADDRLLGSPEHLLDLGPGMIMFMESVLGGIQNNLFCAPKEHPILATAVEMALSALLRRDNDSTWSKTGPGLLSRAAAAYVVSNPESAAANMTLVPVIYVGRHVQQHVALPYKKTPKYWASNSTPISPIVQSALKDCTRSAKVE